ncbi:hypothetical protein DFJ74DRAFT_499895 [Hyaloraphidium curvatum]|nr:hypothetical protein DFJ74DRAFT_499895 [Hyaloraphidium curvatum]
MIGSENMASKRSSRSAGSEKRRSGRRGSLSIWMLGLQAQVQPDQCREASCRKQVQVTRGLDVQPRGLGVAASAEHSLEVGSVHRPAARTVEALRVAETVVLLPRRQVLLHLPAPRRGRKARYSRGASSSKSPRDASEHSSSCFVPGPKNLPTCAKTSGGKHGEGGSAVAVGSEDASSVGEPSAGVRAAEQPSSGAREIWAGTLEVRWRGLSMI